MGIESPVPDVVVRQEAKLLDRKFPRADSPAMAAADPDAQEGCPLANSG